VPGCVREVIIFLFVLARCLSNVCGMCFLCGCILRPQRCLGGHSTAAGGSWKRSVDMHGKPWPFMQEKHNSKLCMMANKWSRKAMEKEKAMRSSAPAAPAPIPD